MRFRRRTPKATLGERLSGPAGFATEIIFTNPPESSATVVSWFLDCPGQSPAWRHFRLSIVHLRPSVALKPAHVMFPGATHEVTLFALDPERNPKPEDPRSWLRLSPINVCEQVSLPDDARAMALLRSCARAVVLGDLPAEPALSGAVEPWHTSLIRTSAHLRGEEHAL